MIKKLLIYVYYIKIMKYIYNNYNTIWFYIKDKIAELKLCIFNIYIHIIWNIKIENKITSIIIIIGYAKNKFYFELLYQLHLLTLYIFFL